MINTSRIAARCYALAVSTTSGSDSFWRMGQKLGQHFLKNTDAITRIIDALDLRRGETVIEIGPGRGALTLPLAKSCAHIGCKLVAIEKDATLVQKLVSSKVGKFDGIKIIHGDALEILPLIIEPFFSVPTRSFGLRPQDDGRDIAVAFKIVGNIPYYITGALLRVVGESPNKPTTTVLMVQREVAERVAAAPPHTNLLAAATQIWADVEILFTLPPSDFDPPPKVESAVITLKIKDQKSKIKKEELDHYYRFIHAAFKQPRKTLANNLQSGKLKVKSGKFADSDKWKVESGKQEILGILRRFGYTEKTRAQELGVERLLVLSFQFWS